MMMDANQLVAHFVDNWVPYSLGGSAGFAAGLMASNPVAVALFMFKSAMRFVPGFRASILKNPEHAKAIVDQIETELDKVIDKEAEGGQPESAPKAEEKKT